MKKKIGLLVSVLIFTLALVGCGSKTKTDLEYDTQEIEAHADSIIEVFAAMQDADFEKFSEGSDLEVNLTLMQAGLPIERDGFVSMMKAWQGATSEYGAYEAKGQYEVESTNKEIKLSTDASFENRSATIEIVFDKHLNMENMSVSGKYSSGEIFQKAGLNTLLGMGTVFGVLIFISFIIYLFNYIPAIQKKFSKEEPKAQMALPITEVNESVDQTNELELIAVISAAIATELDVSTEEFVVRSIKRRVSNNWK